MKTTKVLPEVHNTRSGLEPLPSISNETTTLQGTIQPIGNFSGNGDGETQIERSGVVDPENSSQQTKSEKKKQSKRLAKTDYESEMLLNAGTKKKEPTKVVFGFPKAWSAPLFKNTLKNLGIQAENDGKYNRPVLLLLGGEHLFEWIVAPVRENKELEHKGASLKRLQQEELRQQEKLLFFRRFREKLDKATFELSELNKAHEKLLSSKLPPTVTTISELLRKIRSSRIYVAHLRKLCLWQESHFPYSKLYNSPWNKREECEMFLRGFLSTALHDIETRNVQVTAEKISAMRAQLHELETKLGALVGSDKLKMQKKSHLDDCDASWDGWTTHPFQIGVRTCKLKLNDAEGEAQYVLSSLFLHQYAIKHIKRLQDHMQDASRAVDVVMNEIHDKAVENYHNELEQMIEEWLRKEKYMPARSSVESAITSPIHTTVLDIPNIQTIENGQQHSEPSEQKGIGTHSIENGPKKAKHGAVNSMPVSRPELSVHSILDSTDVLVHIFLENLGSLDFKAKNIRAMLEDEFNVHESMFIDIEHQANMLDELWLEREAFRAYDVQLEIRPKHTCSQSMLSALASQLRVVLSVASRTSATIVTDIVGDHHSSPVFKLLRDVCAKFDYRGRVVGVVTGSAVGQNAWGADVLGKITKVRHEGSLTFGEVDMRPLTHLVCTTGSRRGQASAPRFKIAHALCDEGGSRMSAVAIGLNGDTAVDLEKLTKEKWPVTMVVGEFNSDRSAFSLQFAKLCQRWRLDNSVNSMNLTSLLKHACTVETEAGEALAWVSDSTYSTALFFTITMGNVNVHHVHSKSFNLERVLYRDLCADQALTNANNMRAIYTVNTKINRKPDVLLLGSTLFCSVLQAFLSIVDGNPAVEFFGTWRNFVHTIVIILPVLTSLLINIQETMDAHTKRLKMKRAYLMTEEIIYRYRTMSGKYSDEACFEMEMKALKYGDAENHASSKDAKGGEKQQQEGEIGGQDAGAHTKPQGDEYIEAWQVKQQQVLMEERRELLADVFARRQQLLAEDLKVVADAIGNDVALVYPSYIHKYKTKPVRLDNQEKFDHFDGSEWKSDQFDDRTLSGDDYCWERLTTALLECQKKVRKFSRYDLFSKITVNLLGAAGTILATLNFGIWVPATGAMVTAIGIWSQTERVSHGAVQNRVVAKTLADIRTKWLSKPQEERMRRSNVDQLVDATERTLRILFPEVEDVAAEQTVKGEVKMMQTAEKE